MFKRITQPVLLAAVLLNSYISYAGEVVDFTKFRETSACGVFFKIAPKPALSGRVISFEKYQNKLVLRLVPTELQPIAKDLEVLGFDSKNAIATFEPVIRIGSQTHGLVTIQTVSNEYVEFAVIRNAEGKIIEDSAEFQFQERDYVPGQKNVRFEGEHNAARFRVLDKATEKVRTLQGNTNSLVTSMAALDKRSTAISENGHFLARRHNKMLEVQDLMTPEKVVQITYPAELNDAKAVRVNHVSNDGWSIVVEATVEGQTWPKSYVIDMNRKKVIYEMPEHNALPIVGLYNGGYTILDLDNIEAVEWGTSEVQKYSINDYVYTQIVNSSSTFPAQGFYDGEKKSATIFFQNAPAVRMENLVWSIVEDARAQSDETYLAHTRNQYDQSTDGEWIAQIRQYGAENSAVLNHVVDVWKNGKIAAKVPSFYSVKGVRLSADGSLLAIAKAPTRGSGTKDEEHIWIYSTKDLNVPALKIRNITLDGVDAMTFSLDKKTLFVESRNSGKVIKYDIGLDKL